MIFWKQRQLHSIGMSFVFSVKAFLIFKFYDNKAKHDKLNLREV